MRTYLQLTISFLRVVSVRDTFERTEKDEFYDTQISFNKKSTRLGFLR